MIRFFGDLNRFVESLWSEDRVHRLLSGDWELLVRMRKIHREEVEEAILILNSLGRVEDCKKYVGTLSNTVRDLLLMDLAKDLKDLGNGFGVLQ